MWSPAPEVSLPAQPSPTPAPAPAGLRAPHFLPGLFPLSHAAQPSPPHLSCPSWKPLLHLPAPDFLRSPWLLPLHGRLPDTERTGLRGQPVPQKAVHPPFWKQWEMCPLPTGSPSVLSSCSPQAPLASPSARRDHSPGTAKPLLLAAGIPVSGPRAGWPISKAGVEGGPACPRPLSHPSDPPVAHCGLLVPWLTMRLSHRWPSGWPEQRQLLGPGLRAGPAHASSASARESGPWGCTSPPPTAGREAGPLFPGPSPIPSAHAPVPLPPPSLQWLLGSWGLWAATVAGVVVEWVGTPPCLPHPSRTWGCGTSCSLTRLIATGRRVAGGRGENPGGGAPRDRQPVGPLEGVVGSGKQR